MNANSSQTCNKWLKAAQQKLAAANIATARLDALVLLEDETGKDRSWLLAHPEYELPTSVINALNNKVAQRVLHTPLAYIRGKTEFYGREFLVSPAVLEPRPESETMIDLLLHLPAVKAKNVHIADVGTGSGALGITTKLELPNATVDLLEIDMAAMEMAKKNVVNHAITVNVIESNLLASSPKSYDILLCNLPYVPDDFQINTAAMSEPRIAIFGGPDGLEIYRQLFVQIVDLQKKPLFVLSEALPPQHEALAGIAKSAGYKLQKTDDFIQVFERL